MKKSFIILALCLLLFFDTFGRQGKKLYSIGSNSPWNSASSWSSSANGVTAGVIPQSNDTLIIDRAIIQNVNFIFSENGLLNVLSTGLLRGDNLSLSFNGSSTFKCNGEVKSNRISFSDNSLLFIDNKGLITVNDSFIFNSLNNHVINGKLAVSGTITLNLYGKINGIGAVTAMEFKGNGSIFSINSLSMIPAGSLVSEINWIGLRNSDWNDPNNWAGGVLPKNNSNIAILTSANSPTISKDVIFNDLFVNSTSSITVFPTGFLMLTGNLSVIGGGKLLLKNTTVQKASIIINGKSEGKIQSEYQITSGKSQLVSSPVSSCPSGVFINMYLRPYNETMSQWGEYIVPTNTPLQEMKGYELYSLSNQVRLFEGQPNSDSKSFSITNSGNGLNLSGNPFPSYIDWENEDNDAWQRSSIASAIYYPDTNGSGNYAVYLPGGEDAVSLNNGSRYIAPMQGFFVKAEKAGVLTVNKSSRVNKANLPEQGVNTTTIKLKLSKNSIGCDEVLMRVNPNSTFSFDPNFDALKIPGNTGSSWLYMTSDDDTHYAVNTIPTVNSSYSIPVNIVCAQSGSYTISISGGLNFEYRYPVYLKDKVLNTYIDLRQDSVYTFYHTTAMNTERFEVYFNSPLGIEDQFTDNCRISVLPGKIEVSGSDKEIYSACLYTIDGKLISTSKGSLSDGISLILAKQGLGICILKLNNGNNSITRKVYLN